MLQRSSTLVLQKCNFSAGAAEVNFGYFTYDTCTTKLRFSRCSVGNAICILHWCWLQSCDFRVGAAEMYFACNLAIFQLELRKCTLRNELALESWDFRAGAYEPPHKNSAGFWHRYGTVQFLSFLGSPRFNAFLFGTCRAGGSALRVPTQVERHKGAAAAEAPTILKDLHLGLWIQPSCELPSGCQVV